MIGELPDILQTLTADERRLVAGFEESHRRPMTDQEIRSAVEEFRATIGEL